MSDGETNGKEHGTLNGNWEFVGLCRVEGSLNYWWLVTERKKDMKPFDCWGVYKEYIEIPKGPMPLFLHPLPLIGFRVWAPPPPLIFKTPNMLEYTAMASIQGGRGLYEGPTDHW